jgi:predicted dehydrogenase
MRLAITGCGEISYYTVLAARLNRRIRLTACADPREARRSLFARRFGISRTYPSQEEMLAAEQPDALYLAVPHDLHRPLIAEAAKAGAAVLSEKPLARSAREGAEIIAHLRANNARAAVNYQWRYDARCRALINSCRSGAVGTVRYIRIHLPWLRYAGYFTAAPWHGSRERAGGGTLLTQGSHPLDIALQACPSRPRSARGLCRSLLFQDAEVEDTAFGLLECAGGEIIEICSSMASPPERPVVIEVQGSTGAVRYRGPKWPQLRWFGGNRRLRRRGRPVFSEFDPLYGSLEGFRRWVSGGEPHRCRAEEALPVLQAVDGIYAAALVGGEAPIPGSDSEPGT